MLAFGCSYAEIKVISVYKGKTTKRLGYIKLSKVDIEVNQVDSNWKDRSRNFFLPEQKGFHRICVLTLLTLGSSKRR